jgi:hypothetical protein
MRIPFLAGACALAIVAQTGCSSGSPSGTLPLVTTQSAGELATASNPPLTVRPIPVVKVRIP